MFVLNITSSYSVIAKGSIYNIYMYMYMHTHRYMHTHTHAYADPCICTHKAYTEVYTCMQRHSVVIYMYTQQSVVHYLKSHNFHLQYPQ